MARADASSMRDRERHPDVAGCVDASAFLALLASRVISISRLHSVEVAGLLHLAGGRLHALTEVREVLGDDVDHAVLRLDLALDDQERGGLADDLEALEHVAPDDDVGEARLVLE